MTRHAIRSGALALALAVALASCGGDDATPAKTSSTAPLRIGSKNFTESVIIGELYRQALEASGVAVNLQSSVGSTEVINAALRADSLDMYPEYVGVLLSEVDGIVERPSSADAAYRLAKQREEGGDFTLLDQTKLSNENALAVTKAFARRTGVTSIRDLKRLENVRLGAAPEFRSRFEGLVGLRRRYGLTKLKMRPLELGNGQQYPELDANRIDVALVFTTDSQLAGGRYDILRDPEGVFAANHVAPVVSRKALAEHGPVVARTINRVSALLTTPVMQRLNGQASNARRTPKQIAERFLRENDLTT